MTLTIYKRGSQFLNCLMCGNKDFDIINQAKSRNNILRCKKCDFIFKDSRYFEPIPSSIPEILDNSYYLVARRKGFAKKRN